MVHQLPVFHSYLLRTELGIVIYLSDEAPPGAKQGLALVWQNHPETKNGPDGL